MTYLDILRQWWVTTNGCCRHIRIPAVCPLDRCPLMMSIPMLKVMPFSVYTSNSIFRSVGCSPTAVTSKPASKQGPPGAGQKAYLGSTYMYGALVHAC